MNRAEKAALLDQIEQWNDADEFSRCIEAIEAIPEQERDYLLTLKLGRAYSNLAVLGDHGALGENAEVDGDLLRHAIDLLDKGIYNRVVAMSGDKIVDYDVNVALSMHKTIDTFLLDVSNTISI